MPSPSAPGDRCVTSEQVARVPAVGADGYGTARKVASAETGLPLDAFLDACPFTVAKILDEDWLP